MTRDGIVVAVKCKFVHYGVPPDASARTNYIVDDKLFMFPDGSASTHNAFVCNIENDTPIRVALFHKDEDQYFDHGWGQAEQLVDISGRTRYVINLSAHVNDKFRDREYPSTTGMLQSNFSMRTRYNGNMYDSQLEAQHAAFLDAIGYEYVSQPFPVATQDGDVRMDFHVRERVCEQTHVSSEYIIEVKPTYPSLKEIDVCVNASYTTSIPIVLLYGEMSPPFYTSDTRNSVYRSGKCGLMGLMWSWSDGKMNKQEVVWTDAHGRFSLRCVVTPGQDLTWRTSRLIDAYTHATTVKWENSA